MVKKFFAIDEANQLLPFLRTELASMQQIQKDFYKAYQTLQQIRSQTVGRSESAAVQDSLFEWECKLEFMQFEFDMHFKAIVSKGAQVKDVDLGLIDFPAIYQGEEVLLCWRLGEDSVSHYHSIDEGYAGRKKIY